MKLNDIKLNKKKKEGEMWNFPRDRNQWRDILNKEMNGHDPLEQGVSAS